MSGRVYKDRALVIRSHKLGESDRIIIMLGRNHGLMRVVAKGIRRTTSKFGGRLEPFGVVEVLIHEGKSLDVLTSAHLISAYGAVLARDYESYTAAAVIAELAERLSEDSDPTPANYDLLAGAINSLARRRHRPDLIVAAYVLRALYAEGWAPALVKCAICGLENPTAFDSAAGGAVCADHNEGGEKVFQAEAVFALATALLGGKWEVAEQASANVGNALTNLICRHAQWLIERRIQSLRVLERSQDG